MTPELGSYLPNDHFLRFSVFVQFTKSLKREERAVSKDIFVIFLTKANRQYFLSNIYFFRFFKILSKLNSIQRHQVFGCNFDFKSHIYMSPFVIQFSLDWKFPLKRLLLISQEIRLLPSQTKNIQSDRKW